LSLISSNGKLVLLHRGLKALPKASKYDFVLLPQFYISKREQLPVKYAFQAKKLAPSILEESLPTEYDYDYLVKKEGKIWQFFAYSPKEIENFLQECCGISASKIGKIYFADQLKDVLKKLPIGVDEYNALTLVNGKATVVPRSMIDSDRYARFTNKLRPSSGFNFKSNSKVAQNSSLSKGAIVASILSMLLGGAFIAEGFNYKNAIKTQQMKLGDIYENYPQLQSNLTRDSIKKKYEAIEKKERKIRDLIDTYSQLTSKKSILDKLKLDKGKLIAQFNVSPAEVKKIISIAKDAKLKTKKVNNTLIRVEGELKWVKMQLF